VEERAGLGDAGGYREAAVAIEEAEEGALDADAIVGDFVVNGGEEGAGICVAGVDFDAYCALADGGRMSRAMAWK